MWSWGWIGGDGIADGHGSNVHPASTAIPRLPLSSITVQRGASSDPINADLPQPVGHVPGIGREPCTNPEPELPTAAIPGENPS